MALYLIRLTGTAYVHMEKSFRVKFGENKQSVSSASRDMQLEKGNQQQRNYAWKLWQRGYDSVYMR